MLIFPFDGVSAARRLIHRFRRKFETLAGAQGRVVHVSSANLKDTELGLMWSVAINKQHLLDIMRGSHLRCCGTAKRERSRQARNK